MKKIALEEAFAVNDVESYTPQLLKTSEFRRKKAKLCELADMRLRAMDEGEVEISVLSCTSPSIQGIQDHKLEVETARAWNDYLAEAIEPKKNRFRAFACLPMRNPEAAIDELRRSVKELGFVGALINGYDNSGGQTPIYYDAPEYLDFWKTAGAMDVPVYIHPRPAPDDRETTYKPYPALKGALWGFHVETCEHVLRLIFSGLFDKVPNLKIILGHLGELLPFWCWRMDHRLRKGSYDSSAAGRNEYSKMLTVKEYLERNIYVTTSGYFYTPALEYALQVMGADRVMYAVDYPYEDMAEANEWFNTLNYEPQVLSAIAYDNAKRLLKL